MKKIKYLWPLVAVIAVLLATAGVTYAWFTQSAALATLLEIYPPDAITITPVGDDGTELAALNLDFKDGVDDKVTAEDGATTITIRRPVRIKSTSPVHQLEVVHTTNLNKLEFKIYPASLISGRFSYDPNEGFTGNPINLLQSDPKLAKQENLNNYKDGNTVEDHAYPLYWLANCCGARNYVKADDWLNSYINVTSERSEEYDSAKQCNTYYYSTYYILEITWQETTKETDLFYILAQNIAVESVDPGEGGGNS